MLPVTAYVRTWNCPDVTLECPGTKNCTEALEIVRTELACFPVRALFYRLCHLVESFFVMGQGLFVSGSSIRS